MKTMDNWQWLIENKIQNFNLYFISTWNALHIEKVYFKLDF